MNARGFSLLEVLTALALVSLAVAGILPAFMVHLESNTRSEVRAGAVLAVERTMEALRLENPADLPTSGQSAPQLITVAGREYQVVVRYCVKGEYCNAGSRHLAVEVSEGGHPVYAVETVYTQLL
jgi:prepilin-type N-terminal cleavage/methylation domain-containing protein